MYNNKQLNYLNLKTNFLIFKKIEEVPQLSIKKNLTKKSSKYNKTIISK